MTHIQAERYQFDENPGGRPLKFFANCHRFTAFSKGRNAGIILILFHGAGFTKETLIPFLNELAAMDVQGGRAPTIKEAWTIDVPNHGESARLNEQYLFEDRRDVLLEEYARCGLRLLRSGHVKEMEKHRAIVIGHSVGSLAALWLASLYHTEDHKSLSGCLLIEPSTEAFMEPTFTETKSVILAEPTKIRRDIWASKEEARAWFAKRMPWKNWDPRVLDEFMKHGLRELPSVWYPDRQGVTLSLPRHQEAWIYENVRELNSVAACVPDLRKYVPIHSFISKRSFLSPNENECEELLEKKGFSYSMLPSRSDHLVVLDMPKESAHCVLEVLGKPPYQVQGDILASRL